MPRTLFVVGLVLLGLVRPAIAQDQWVRIAAIEIPPGKEDPQFEPWRAKGQFKALRLVSNTPISDADLIVQDSGCRQQQVTLNLTAGVPSDPVELASGKAFVDSVYLAIRAARRKIGVELWGLQAPDAGAVARSSDPAVAGFQIDFSADHRSMYFCRMFSAEDEVQLEAVGSDVFIRSLHVTYETDQTEVVSLDGMLRRNVRSRKFRLQGAGRIRSMQLVYRPEPDVKALNARVKVSLSSSWDLRVRSGRVGPPELRCEYPCGAHCVYDNTCTPVEVFFGTNRERANRPDRVAFGPERGEQLSLGRAIVTVPRFHGVGKVERPSYWSAVDLLQGLTEDPTRHFTIVPSGVRTFSTAEEFVAATRASFRDLTDFKDHAFVYVHGFKVTFDEALFRTAQIAFDLGIDRRHNRIPFGLPFLYSWPARGGLLDYAADTESARAAEGHLREFLQLVAARSGARYIHVIAHSMGTQPVLNVLAQMAGAHPEVKFTQIVLAAPDVDRKQFVQITNKLAPIARNVTLYASARDEAMIVSRRVHSGLPRAGDVPPEGPVVLRGLDTIDATALSSEVFSASHSKYAEDTSLLKDIGLLMRDGLRPPHLRTPSFARRTSGALEYWVSVGAGTP